MASLTPQPSHSLDYPQRRYSVPLARFMIDGTALLSLESHQVSILRQNCTAHAGGIRRVASLGGYRHTRLSGHRAYPKHCCPLHIRQYNDHK